MQTEHTALQAKQHCNSNQLYRKQVLIFTISSWHDLIFNVACISLGALWSDEHVTWQCRPFAAAPWPIAKLAAICTCTFHWDSRGTFGPAIVLQWSDERSMYYVTREKCKSFNHYIVYNVLLNCSIHAHLIDCFWIDYFSNYNILFVLEFSTYFKWDIFVKTCNNF